MTIHKRLNRIVLFAVVIVCAFILSAIMTDRAHAAVTVLNNSTGEKYSSIAAAVNDISDGSEATLTVSGSYNNGLTLSKNATITIVAADEGFTQNGSITVSKGKIHLKGINIKGGVFYTGAGTDGTIKDCKITNASGTGVGVTSNATITEISNTDITAYNYGVRLTASNNVSVNIGKISGCNITTTSSGNINNKSTSPIYIDGGWGITNSSIKVGTIEKCKIVSNGLHLEDAGISILRTSHIDSQEIEIGTITDTDIECNNGGSGMFVHEAYIGTIKNVNIHTNISDTGKERHSNGIYCYHSSIQLLDNVDILSEGISGTGLYLAQKSGVLSVGEIKDVTVDAPSNGMDSSSGIVGNISNSSFTSHQIDTGTSNGYAAIHTSGGTFGDLTNVKLYSGAYGIYKSTGSQMGDLNGCTIKANHMGIYQYGSTMGDITNTTINSKNNYSINNYTGIIGEISKSTIKNEATGTPGIAILNNGKADISSIKESTISGYVGIYSNGTSSGPNTIGKIDGNTIETTGVGIQIRGGKVDEMVDNDITGINGIIIQNHKNTSGTINNTGVVTKIAGGSIEASKGGISLRGECTTDLISEVKIDAGTYGIEVQSVCEIKSIEDNTINAGTYGVDVKANGKAGTLEGNTISAVGDDAYEAVIIRTDGEITEIKSGTYTGQNQGLNVQGNLETISGGKFVGTTGNGMQIVGSGMTETISGGEFTGATNGLNNQNILKLITGSPVFYGKNGYAIRNTSENTDEPITVEPGISPKLMGDARYYGKEGEFADETIDKYPVYKKDTDEEQTYSMSESTVPVDGIDGVKFHYLTIKASIEYDSNGGEGDMTEDEYTGEWKPELKVASNKFTLKNHTFAGWNTKSDGKGKSYSPGDEVDTTKLILYAQWTRNAPTPGTQNLTGEVKLLWDNVAKPFEDEEFSVNIEEGTGNPVDGLVDFTPEEVGVPSSGLFSFAQIKFAKEGTYNFLVSQKKGSKTGYIYDLDSVNVEMEVVFDDDENTYVVKSISYKKAGKEASGILFVNEYKPLPCKGDPPVKKKVTGNPTNPETFAFELRPLENTYPMPDEKIGGKKIMTIEGAGSFEFGEIIFDKEGTYAYTVSELIPKDSIRYKYDNSIWKIVYEVVDNNGQLEATRTFYKNDKKVEGIQSAEFVNEYEIVDEGPAEEEYSEDPEEDEDKDKDKVVKKAKVVQQKISRYAKTGDDFNVNLWMAVVFTTFVLMMFGVIVGRINHARSKSR